MKFGAHCYLFVDRWADVHIPLLDLAKELGLDIFELSVGDDVSFSPNLTRERAEALDMELIISPGGAWPLHCDISADAPEDRTAGISWHKRQIDLAAEMGATAYAGAIYGHPGVVRRRRPPADEYRRTAEGLHALATYADERDMAILLEPMSHFRTHLVNTPEQLMRLLDLAGHENLHGLLDTYHLVTEVRNYDAAIRVMGSRLWGIHACENDRGAPGGGLVPWDDVFAALAEIGFDGYVGMESYNSSLHDFAWERGMFHNVCPDGAAFVRQGLAFLREMQHV